MALYGSLQLSHGVGLCRNQGCYKTEKNALRRTRLHQPNSSPSLHTSLQQHGSWNYLISDYFHRPKFSVLHRNSVPHRTVSCHSVSAAGKTIEPVVKAATLTLTKWLNVIQNFPIVYKLVPSIALLIFSIWGLVPFVRQGRNLLLNKSDNNWKKSSTYHVMTSYIQPLLLWFGALFVCRALDPVVLPTEASQVVKDRLLNFVRSLSTVLAFAYCLSSLTQQTQKFFTETSDPNDTRNMGFQFVGKAIYSAVWVAAISLFMELLGFSTQKWLTAGGLGTVLITLAGREIFTNFLSSVMIHATRPFVVNEWIQTKIEGYEVSGTVEHVGWWSPTIIRAEDREAVHIPNHKFTVNVVRNLSQKTHWRIKTHLAISHLDVNKINNIVADMRKVLAKNPQVEQQKLHRRVFLDNVNPENQALLILISCFVKTSHHEEYLCVKEAILLDLLRVISHHRARLATPIRTIRKMYTDSDLENPPFGDSVYDQNGVASRRPLLLIEPSYRINGEDKTKSQNRASNKSTTVEQENKSSSSKIKEGTDEVVIKPATKSVSKPNLSNDSETSKVKSINSGIKPLKGDGDGESERGDGLGSSSVSRSSLEENIVLGVALEGSKRTLPIEEEMNSASAMAADSKELAGARRNGDKEKKDSQDQTNTGAAAP